MPRTQNLTKLPSSRTPTAWPDTVSTNQLRTPHDHLCTAYHRCADGIRLATHRPVAVEANLLVVVERGTLLLASSHGPVVTVEAGDSVLLIPGEVCLTETPEPGGEVSYWLIDFRVALLREVVGEGLIARHFALSVPPLHHGIYAHRNTLPSLRAVGLPTPVDDVTKTFTLMMMSMSVPVFSFLRDIYFQPRAVLQGLAKQGYRATDPLPGGHPFGQMFELFHGEKPKEWLRHQKNGRPTNVASWPSQQDASTISFRATSAR